MTTATMAPPETAEEEKIWTLREVEKQAETLAELREKLVSLAAEEEELRERLGTALADGEDAEGIKAEIRETVELRKDLEVAEPVLAERIRERHYLAHQELARQRLQTIQKKVGGLAGEAPRRAEKAAELAEDLVRQLEWLVNAPARRKLFQEEARILAERFDLDVPELRNLDVDTGKSVAAAKGAVRAVAGFPNRPIITVRSNRSAGKTAKAAAAVAKLLRRHFEEESPVVELLAAVEDTEGEA